MRFVNSFELSSILAQPQICSSNPLGAMASLRDEGHFETVKKVARKIWKNHYELMLRRMAAKDGTGEFHRRIIRLSE